MCDLNSNADGTVLAGDVLSPASGTHYIEFEVLRLRCVYYLGVCMHACMYVSGGFAT